MTQEQVAERLGVARTTVTAIEKGERRLQPDELIRLAELFAISVNELLRRRTAQAAFAVQLKASLGVDDSPELDVAIAEFQSLCDDYLSLEELSSAPLALRYPSPYLTTGAPPEVLAEDIAEAERQRLNLGDGPIANLVDVLEQDVGLRLFVVVLPSKVAALFAYTDALGGCIAVNARHPAERQRLSIGHEYGHFLTSRLVPEVTVLKSYVRVPESERLADAFARAFLMPSGGLRRRFLHLQQSRGGHVTPAELIRLARIYAVSVEAMSRRLEELRLLPSGTFDLLQQKGFQVREAQALLGIESRKPLELELPARYRHLAAEAFSKGLLSEGQLARILRMNRLEARAEVERVAREVNVSDAGDVENLQLDLNQELRQQRRRAAG
jgi:Zn-dependent peptidase ImmA (M78 family)/DNA-binding XRE family transcriptional regulator